MKRRSKIDPILATLGLTCKQNPKILAIQDNFQLFFVNID